MDLLSHVLLERLPVFELALAVQADLGVQLLLDQVEELLDEHDVVRIADLQVVHLVQVLEQNRSIAGDRLTWWRRWFERDAFHYQTIFKGL